MIIELNKTTKLHPVLATVKRIADVAGFLNSDLRAEIRDDDMFVGVACGFLDQNRILIEWGRTALIGTMGFSVQLLTANVNCELNNIITFQDQCNPDEWKKFAEAIGNIILDKIKHGNVDIPKEAQAGGVEDDPDVGLDGVHSGIMRMPNPTKEEQ